MNFDAVFVAPNRVIIFFKIVWTCIVTNS